MTPSPGFSARRFHLIRASDGRLICAEETWEKCRPFFRSLHDSTLRLSYRYVLHDTETGRRWEAGDAYDWEAART